MLSCRVPATIQVAYSNHLEYGHDCALQLEWTCSVIEALAALQQAYLAA